VDKTGSGSCAIAGFNISGVATTDSAATVLFSYERQVVMMGRDGTLLRIVSNGGLSYYRYFNSEFCHHSVCWLYADVVPSAACKKRKATSLRPCRL
jgi:hypothetical protein